MSEEPSGGVPQSEGLTVATVRTGAAATVRLRGDLDLATVPSLRRELAVLLADRTIGELTVEVGELTFCDACGLSPLVKAVLELRARGASLRLSGARPGLRRLLETLHLTADFGL